MDVVTNGLIKALAFAMLENLPYRHARGEINWEALNAARVQIMSLIGQAENADDRQMLIALLAHLG